jgi:putative ABC transport system substrate-binding protein
MRRREFITLTAGAAATWSFAARAQQSATPVVIGFLSSASPEALAHLLTAMRQGLKETGYTEGQNLVIEYRTASADYGQFPELAADLIRRRVALIITPSPAPALAAKLATTTIPIVFYVSGDPLRLGLVPSINRPGGNITGVSRLEGALGSKRLELLRQLLPAASLIGVLVNPISPLAKVEIADVSQGASALGQPILVLEASSARDLEQVFATLAERKASGLLVEADPFIGNQLDQLVRLAARYAIPAIFERREFPAAGGLMSYGSERLGAYHQVGVYAGRILKGEKPGDLPVLQSTKFELVINVKTAKALGLVVPPTLLALADEVVE